MERVVDLRRHPILYTEAVVKEKQPDVPLTTTGRVGLGLAHLKAWELVAQRTTPHLILEDDSVHDVDELAPPYLPWDPRLLQSSGNFL